MSRLGDAILAERRKRGHVREEAALLHLDTSRGTLHRWESGTMPVPAHKAALVSEYLDRPLSEVAEQLVRDHIDSREESTGRRRVA